MLANKLRIAYTDDDEDGQCLFRNALKEVDESMELTTADDGAASVAAQRSSEAAGCGLPRPLHPALQRLRSAVDNPSLAPNDLNSVVAEVLADLAGELKDRHALVRAGTLPTADGDPFC